MDNELKKRNKIIITLAIIILLIVSLSLSSLIIGYLPMKKENALVDWIGIAAILQLLTFISVVAIAAMQIVNNNKIAKRQDANNKDIALAQERLLKEQNKIAIFEKRYEMYQFVKRVLYCFNDFDGTEVSAKNVYLIIMSTREDSTLFVQRGDEITSALSALVKTEKSRDGREEARRKQKEIEAKKKQQIHDVLSPFTFEYEKLKDMWLLFNNISNKNLFDNNLAKAIPYVSAIALGKTPDYSVDMNEFYGIISEIKTRLLVQMESQLNIEVE